MKKRKKRLGKFVEELMSLKNFLSNREHFGRSRVLDPDKKKYRRKPKHRKDYSTED